MESQIAPYGSTSHGVRPWRVIMDRLQFVVPDDGLSYKGKTPNIPDFVVRHDTFVRSRTSIQTYRRVRALENPKTGSRAFVQYKRAHGFLKPFKVTMVANDATGLPWDDLQVASDAFSANHFITMAEIAVDFPANAGIGNDFVKKYALFGKSRPRTNKKFPGLLQYGSRRSPRFVRCYWKKEINAFRIELEFHFRYPYQGPYGIYLLTGWHVGKKELDFVKVDWQALRKHLQRKDIWSNGVLSETKARRPSIHGFLRYLRNSLGVTNPHRFLRSMKLGETVRQAIEDFGKSYKPSTRSRELEAHARH